MEHALSPFCTEFGRRVARRRRILGLTQVQVAARLGLKRSHVSQLEQGKYRSMQLAHLAALADVLQTSADYLLQRIHLDPGPVPA
jgi:transcriptional regulator with XRE-family HTH domain